MIHKINCKELILTNDGPDPNKCESCGELIVKSVHAVFVVCSDTCADEVFSSAYDCFEET